MTTHEAPNAPEAPVSRDEMITMVSRAHKGASYAESSLAGKTLAAQSKLPRLIAENLGAGFGQWDFFPEATAIVDFAHAYVPPANEEDVWALARSWASDDAAGRQTLLALVGRDILEHELRRVAVPKLRELFDEPRASRARAIRTELGLATPALAPIKDEAKATKVPTPRTERAPAKAVKQPIPTRMPPPEFKRPAKAAPPPPPKRFQHPKFGEGELLSQAGEGPESKLTIKFERGPVTVQAKYVTEI